METNLKIKRNYTKRTTDQKHDRLVDRLSRLKLGQAKKDELIRKLEAKLKPTSTTV